jgi:hypothetical protein
LKGRGVNRLEPFLGVAGVLQWLVASSNLFAARIFRYRENMARVTPFVREVFIVGRDTEPEPSRETGSGPSRTRRRAREERVS